jgi:hypothetical protein
MDRGNNNSDDGCIFVMVFVEYGKIGN